MKYENERRGGLIACAAVLLAFLPGCASMGPPTINRDRLEYHSSVAESWQRQLLLNMVKLRYGDTPLFLDVASITNSYALETQVGAGVAWADVIGSGASSAQNLSGAARYSDRPTITYSPMTGSRFTKSLMTPPSPAVVISLIQAGWAADAVMRLMVTSANGVQNRFSSGGRARGADPEFYRLISALRRIQSTGSIGMKLDRSGEADAGTAILQLTELRGESDEVDKDRREVREILGLRQGVSEMRVVFGSTRESDEEVSMITRSMLEVLMDLSGSAIEVPPVHVEEGRVAPSRAFSTDAEGGYVPLLKIQSGTSVPTDVFVAIEYRGHWFWIDDRDYGSKAIFSFLLVLSSLTETDSPKGAPVITIPAG